MLALSGTSVLDPACTLITGSAALLVCGAASALPKLQEEARAGEQRLITTGNRFIGRQRMRRSGHEQGCCSAKHTSLCALCKRCNRNTSSFKSERTQLRSLD